MCPRTLFLVYGFCFTQFCAFLNLICSSKPSRSYPRPSRAQASSCSICRTELRNRFELGHSTDLVVVFCVAVAAPLDVPPLPRRREYPPLPALERPPRPLEGNRRRRCPPDGPPQRRSLPQRRGRGSSGSILPLSWIPGLSTPVAEEITLKSILVSISHVSIGVVVVVVVKD